MAFKIDKITNAELCACVGGLFTAMVMTDAHRTFLEDTAGASRDAREQRWSDEKQAYIGDAFDWAVRFLPAPVRARLLPQREEFIVNVIAQELN